MFDAELCDLVRASIVGHSVMLGDRLRTVVGCLRELHGVFGCCPFSGTR